MDNNSKAASEPRNSRRRFLQFRRAVESGLARKIPEGLHPNHLSVLRIVLSLFILGLGLSDVPLWWLLPPTLLGALTDALDGILARGRKQVTILGTYLDPAADKLLAVVFIVIVIWRGLAPAYLMLLVLAVDLHAVILPIMIYIHKKRRRQPLWPPQRAKASFWGKMKTTVLLCALALLLLANIVHWSLGIIIAQAGLWAAVVLGAIAFAGYMKRWRQGLVN